MAVVLRPLTDDEVMAFAESSFRAYLHEQVESGEDAEAVAAQAEGQFASMFPDRRRPPGHLFWRVEENGHPRGTIWIGPVSLHDPRTYWVWDIVIDEAERGRGLGKQAMLLAEEHAREVGGTRLGLSVFAHNSVARRLYDQLGYTPTSTRMTKAL